MASARDKVKVMENIMGRVGAGGDVLAEYCKALSTMSGLDMMNETTPPPLPAGSAINTQTPMISPEVAPNTTPMQSTPQMP